MKLIMQDPKSDRSHPGKLGLSALTFSIGRTQKQPSSTSRGGTDGAHCSWGSFLPARQPWLEMVAEEGEGQSPIFPEFLMERIRGCSEGGI